MPKPGRPPARSFAAAALALVVAPIVACQHVPQPVRGDPDGAASGAVALELGSKHTAELDCGWLSGDCSDWFRIEVPAAGRLSVTIEPAEPADLPIAVELRGLEASEPPLASGACAPGASCRIQHRVEPGSQLIAVSIEPGARVHYELTTHLQTHASSRAVSDSDTTLVSIPARIVEFEVRPDGVQTLVIQLGEGDGVRVGTRGRLLRAGSTLAEFEVREVYPDGSRAQILDRQAMDVSQATGAEVDVRKPNVQDDE